MEYAVLGGGCFWCLEAVYTELKGVSEVQSGYAGGHVDNPSYREVCGKQTGHAEVVRVGFDPAVISFADILRVFFTIHDPTTPNRQGNDVGPQYRSIILAEDDTQLATARAVREEIAAAGIWANPIVTEIVPKARFWPAEAEHHRYFERNPYQGYCAAIIAPKVAKFRKGFAERLKA